MKFTIYTTDGVSTDHEVEGDQLRIEHAKDASDGMTGLGLLKISGKPKATDAVYVNREKIVTIVPEK